jgi:hypothetical protein
MIRITVILRLGLMAILVLALLLLAKTQMDFVYAVF